jgi:hypothetical protein
MDNTMGRNGLPPVDQADEWTFLGGKWREGEEGELVPPEAGTGPFLAVAHHHEYADFQAEFHFRFRPPTSGGVRLVFRLQDATRYYALDIPWVGQQNRGRHMWAGIVVADGTPLQRYLSLQLIPGITPQHNRWYRARVECSGPRIRAWVDGRPVCDLEDHSYQSGRIGLMGIVAGGKGGNALLPANRVSSAGKTDFAKVRVAGTPVGPSAWPGLTEPEPHWITPCMQVDPETYQGYPNLIRSKSGELTASIPFNNPCGEAPLRTVWVRSRDGGRSWSEPEPATLQKGFGGSFVRRDGTWVCVHVKPGVPPQEAVYTYESADEGRTWTGPRPLNVQGEWPPEFSLSGGPSGQPLRLRDGALLIPMCCRMEIGSYVNAKFDTDFVFRSADDGHSWAAPVWCDRNNYVDPDTWFSAGNFNEIGLAETDDNVVIGYGRPGPWPRMWRVQSNDGGRTWQPAAFGSFPGYCISLTSTASGALVAVHRFPYLTANVSYDGGVTWDAGTIVDYAVWANHKALEVEPDVVLVNYMGMYEEPGQADIRMARLRVTQQGLVLDN